MHKWLILPYPNPPPLLPVAAVVAASAPVPNKETARFRWAPCCVCASASEIVRSCWGGLVQFIYLLTHSLTHPHTLIHTFIHATINSYCSLLSTASASTSASASASQRAVIKTTLVIRPRSPLSLSLSASVLLSATLTLTPILTPTVPVPLAMTGAWNRVLVWGHATPCSSRIYGRWLRLTKLSKLSSQSPMPFRSSASTFHHFCIIELLQFTIMKFLLHIALFIFLLELIKFCTLSFWLASEILA